MIIYDILLILQYQVSTTVMDLIVVFCIVFMFALLCFYVATEFSVNKDLYLYIGLYLLYFTVGREMPLTQTCQGPEMKMRETVRHLTRCTYVYNISVANPVY